MVAMPMFSPDSLTLTTLAARMRELFDEGEPGAAQVVPSSTPRGLRLAQGGPHPNAGELAREKITLSRPAGAWRS